MCSCVMKWGFVFLITALFELITMHLAFSQWNITNMAHPRKFDQINASIYMYNKRPTIISVRTQDTPMSFILLWWLLYLTGA